MGHFCCLLILPNLSLSKHVALGDRNMHLVQDEKSEFSWAEQTVEKEVNFRGRLFSVEGDELGRIWILLFVLRFGLVMLEVELALLLFVPVAKNSKQRTNV